MAAEHTPTPWRLHSAFTDRVCAGPKSPDGVDITDCGARMKRGVESLEEREANAALIVRAVNRDALFDEVVEALASWADAYPEDEEDNGEMELWARYGSEFAMAMRKTRAALTKAREARS